MRVEGITSLTSGLQIKPVSRTPEPLPPPPRFFFMPPATGLLRTNQFFWRCWIDEGHKNNVVFSRSQKHPCPFPLTGNQLAPISTPRRHAVELHRQAGRQEGRQDTGAIMPASCQRSLDIPFQASSRDRLQTRVIPWQTRKGGKKN